MNQAMNEMMNGTMSEMNKTMNKNVFQVQKNSDRLFLERFSGFLSFPLSNIRLSRVSLSNVSTEVRALCVSGRKMTFPGEITSLAKTRELA